ncbi:hypothetical protein TWF481_011082 [Arthrobotrys musiformis]|uniref:Thioredoxin domain-containing protein n=1 Tax=Arthrobotrys musiformis TaxID=47236 RepID=A0AAV9VX93_9PEZI
MTIKEIPAESLSVSDPTTSLQTFLESLGRPLYIFFTASADPATSAPWCPDVRAAIPVVTSTFQEAAQELSVVTVEVGDKPSWKDANNVFKKEWGLTAIPTLGRYEVVDVDGQSIVAVRMLVENECLDVSKLLSLIS